MDRAAAAPWRRALAQWSTRMWRPNRGRNASAMSPAAYTAGSAVRRCSSTATPFADFQAGVGCETGVRSDADADEHQVGGQQGAVSEPYAVHPVVLALDGRDLGAAAQLDAMFTVQTGEHQGSLAHVTLSAREIDEALDDIARGLEAPAFRMPATGACGRAAASRIPDDR